MYPPCYELTSDLLLIGWILSYLIYLPGSLIRGHLVILSYRTSDLDLIKMDHYHIWRRLSGIWLCGHYYKVLGTHDIHMLEAWWTFIIHRSVHTAVQYYGHALDMHI